jgi:hypothetical protein
VGEPAGEVAFGQVGPEVALDRGVQRGRALTEAQDGAAPQRVTDAGVEDAD